MTSRTQTASNRLLPCRWKSTILTTTTCSSHHFPAVQIVRPCWISSVVVSLVSYSFAADDHAVKMVNLMGGPPDDPHSKTPVMLLHELYRDRIVFDTGDPRGLYPDVVFDCVLHIDGRTFTGAGVNKKAAKQAAATAAVTELRMSGQLSLREREMLAVKAQKRFINPDRVSWKQQQQQHEPQSQQLQFKQFLRQQQQSLQQKRQQKEQQQEQQYQQEQQQYQQQQQQQQQYQKQQQQQQQQQQQPKAWEQQQQSLMSSLYRPEQKPGKQPPLPKNSIMHLNDKYRSLPYTVVSGNDSSGWVTMTVLVEGIAYGGQGTTQKQAKLSAAENALRGLGDWTAVDEGVKRMLAATEALKPPRPAFGRGGGTSRGGTSRGVSSRGGTSRGRGGRGSGRGSGSLRGAAVANAGRWVRGGVVNYKGGNWTSSDKGRGDGAGYNNSSTSSSTYKLNAYQTNGGTQDQRTGATRSAHFQYGDNFGATSVGHGKPQDQGQSSANYGTGASAFMSPEVVGYSESAVQPAATYSYTTTVTDSYVTGAYQSGYGEGSYEGAVAAYAAGTQW